MVYTLAVQHWKIGLTAGGALIQSNLRPHFLPLSADKRTSPQELRQIWIQKNADKACHGETQQLSNKIIGTFSFNHRPKWTYLILYNLMWVSCYL